MILVVDIGNVLISVSLKRRAAELAAYQRSHGLELVGYTDIAESWLDDYSVGRLSTERYLRQLSSMFHVPEGVIRRAEAACIGELNTDLVNEIDSLAKKVSVCCLSNTQPLHWEKVISMLPTTMFSQTFVSFQTGLSKPGQAAYRAVLKSTKSRGEDVVFIDDDERNIHAARSAGWKHCHQHTGNTATLRWLRGLPI